MNQPHLNFLGLGASVPEKRLTNQDLAKMVDTNEEWIMTRTGIQERRILSESEMLTDHSTAAAKEALANAGITAQEIELVIVATYTPDRLAPSVACKTTELLGIPYVPAMDLNAACSGFIYALSVANAFIQNNTYKKILIISAEAQSRYVDYSDRSTCILFGDGAAAAVVGGTLEEGKGLLGVILGADSSCSELFSLPHDGKIFMNGREVFKFAVRTMNEALAQSIKKAGIEESDVDFLIPHQANIRIIDSAAERLKLPAERVVRNIYSYGNTAAVSIPLALYECWKDGRIQPGNVLALVGFGAGFTYGSAIVRW
ncbi:MAG: beta-ketoacyl-ACP synthase III [Sumerlaeia bacterium]